MSLEALRAKSVKPVVIDGQTFYVRKLNLAGRLTFADMVRNKKPNAELAGFILGATLCDESGNLFPNEDLSDVDADIGQVLVHEAMALSGLLPGTVDATKKD